MGLVLMLEKDKEYESRNDFSFAVHRLFMAVKSVLPEFLDDEARILFRRELTVWAGFDHPHVVPLSEILEAGSDGWVAAMPRCEGSLIDVLNTHRKLNLQEATFILSDIVDGLAYAFTTSKVLHLDLKPGNILYDWDPDRGVRYPEDSIRKKSYLVSDWGLASIKEPQLERVAGLPPSHEEALRTFNNLGTILYMAPERFVRGIRSSVPSDVFSLGLIYFQLLFGRLPYEDGVHPVVQLTLHDYYGTARQILAASTFSKRLNNILLRMLHPVPGSRYSEYDELKSDLCKVTQSARPVMERIFGVTSSPKASDIYHFIRRKGSTQKQHEDFLNRPEVRSVICAAGSEQVVKQVENLQAAGRQQEANDRILKYTESAFRQWQADPRHPSYLIRRVILVVRKHSDKRVALGLLELLLQTLKGMQHTIDLTEIYFNLGGIYAQMGLRDDSLRAYHMAAETKAPDGCEDPAMPKVKAVAHYQAREAARRLNDKEKYELHSKKLASLVPGTDLNQVEKFCEFVSGERIDLNHEEAGQGL